MKKILFFLGILCIVFLCGCEKIGATPPAAITFRYSMLDTTRVLQVTNKSNSETLVMRIEAKNHEKNQEASHIFKVAPGSTYEIGRLEMDWVFEKGETYTIHADGYPIPITGTVP